MTIVHHLKSRPALQAILYLPVILGLIILASISMRWSLADVYATQLSYHLDAVKKKAVNKNVKQWRQARQHLEKALDLRSAYPRYFELGEAFYQKLESLEFRRDPLIQKLGWHNNELEALNHARYGLRLTPSWPYLWNRLAISKLALKQFDNELTGAIERAVYLGPWEKNIQYAVAMLGSNAWPNLQDKAHPLVQQAMEKACVMDHINHSDEYDFKKMLPDFRCAQGG